MRVPTSKEFRDVASILKIISPEYVEKDYYAVQLLKLFFEEIKSDQFDFHFAGGTGLAKCHIDTERFSEDVDIKMKPLGIPSRSERKKISLNVTNMINYSDLFSLESQAKIADQYRSQAFHIYYPAEIKNTSSSMKPFLQLELTECDLSYQPKVSTVASLYSKVSGVSVEISQCYSTNLTYIAAEKLIALLRRIAQAGGGKLNHEDPYLIRHVYDLTKILESNLLSDTLDVPIKNVIELDISKYKAHNEFGADPIAELKFGFEQLCTNKKYQDHFNDYLVPFTYGTSTVSWDLAIQNIQSIVETIH